MGKHGKCVKNIKYQKNVFIVGIFTKKKKSAHLFQLSLMNGNDEIAGTVSASSGVTDYDCQLIFYDFGG
ncbi:MAG: hypothetical protein DDT19_01040 [Syntrophomonadaceae bacterium]|nr:hypothetical protein [Bacillota bacterium]